MKDTEFIADANIASLEQMQQFTKGFKTFADSHKDMVAQAYQDGGNFRRRAGSKRHCRLC